MQRQNIPSLPLWDSDTRNSSLTRYNRKRLEGSFHPIPTAATIPDHYAIDECHIQSWQQCTIDPDRILPIAARMLPHRCDLVPKISIGNWSLTFENPRIVQNLVREQWHWLQPFQCRGVFYRRSVGSGIESVDRCIPSWVRGIAWSFDVASFDGVGTVRYY